MKAGVIYVYNAGNGLAIPLALTSMLTKRVVVYCIYCTWTQTKTDNKLEVASLLTRLLAETASIAIPLALT